MSQCPGVGHTAGLTGAGGPCSVTGVFETARVPCVTLRGQKLGMQHCVSCLCAVLLGVPFLWAHTGVAVCEPGCRKVPAFKGESNQQDLTAGCDVYS